MALRGPDFQPNGRKYHLRFHVPNYHLTSRHLPRKRFMRLFSQPGHSNQSGSSTSGSKPGWYSGNARYSEPAREAADPEGRPLLARRCATERDQFGEPLP